MSGRESIRKMLAAGRRLDPGRVCEVVERIEEHPGRLAQLVECIWDDEIGIANRAADVLERVTRERPQRAQRWKESLLGLMAEARDRKLDKKLRWNLALVVPRLQLTGTESRRASAVLQSWLDDQGSDPGSDASSLVKTAALHGLADLTRQNPSSLRAVIELLQVACRSGTPAMRARSRILLKALERPQPKSLKRSSIHMFD
jgi:hypothetical protein